jgi:hypothetical protein
MESIEAQQYPNLRIIVSYDNMAALQYISLGTYVIPVYREPGEFSYNLYCNALKSVVDDGYFLFLDDDDTLLLGVLHEIAPHLIGAGIICQFLRNEWRRPTDSQMRAKVLRRGHIGLPCIILHHSLKAIADVGSHEFADYDYIREVSDKVILKWVTIPMVRATVRSRGIMETNNI